MDMTNEQIMLNTRALSIHRASLRRKLDKMRPNTREYALTLDELKETQLLLNQLADEDIHRLGAA